MKFIEIDKNMNLIKQINKIKILIEINKKLLLNGK